MARLQLFVSDDLEVVWTDKKKEQRTSRRKVAADMIQHYQHRIYPVSQFTWNIVSLNDNIDALYEANKSASLTCKYKEYYLPGKSKFTCKRGSHVRLENIIYQFKVNLLVNEGAFVK